MTTAIKIPIQQLTPQLIQEWQEKYPNGAIEVRTQSETTPERMAEEITMTLLGRSNAGVIA